MADGTIDDKQNSNNIPIDLAKKFARISGKEKIPLTGIVALNSGLLSKAQFDEVLKYCENEKKAGRAINFENALVEKKYISLDMSMKLIAATIRKMNRELGEIAVEKGLVTQVYIDKALNLQAEKFKSGGLVLISDILIKAGLLGEKQRDEIFDIQNMRIMSSVFAGDSPESEKFSGKELLTPASSDEIMLIVGEDSLKAEIIIPADYHSIITIEEIKKMIEDHDILFGVADNSIIEEYLAYDQSKIRRFVVAEGIAVKAGSDAELILNFKREYLNPGKITEDGKIDFKDRGAVPVVSKGDLLLDIIPELEGTSGMDVFGNLLSVPAVNSINVIAGKGTLLLDDGLRIIAEKDGQPNISINGEVSVFSEITIPGDVDFNTGNIVFDGHITVKGMVKEGFSVTGGTLTVNEIDGGIINLKGNLEVAGGIINSRIKTHGNIQAMYMADSIVDSYGDVIIKKEIIDSTIDTSAACISEKTKIISSSIAAMKGIDAAQIGTDVSKNCSLKVGVNVHVEKEIQAIKDLLVCKTALLAEKQAVLIELENEQAKIHEIIALSAQIQDDSEVKCQNMKKQLENLHHAPVLLAGDEEKKIQLISEIAKIQTAIRNAEQSITDNFDIQDGAMNKALKAREICEILISEIEQQNLVIEGIKKWARKQKKVPFVKVSSGVYSGTIIMGPNSSITIKETMRNCSVKEITRETEQGHYAWEMRIVPN